MWRLQRSEVTDRATLGFRPEGGILGIEHDGVLVSRVIRCHYRLVLQERPSNAIGRSEGIQPAPVDACKSFEPLRCRNAGTGVQKG